MISKTFMMVIIAIAILNGIALVWLFSKNQKLQEGFQENQTLFANQIQNIKNIKDSNASLQRFLQERDSEYNNSLAQLTTFIKSENDAKARIEELSVKFSDAERNQRLDDLAKSKRAGLMERIANKNTRCEIEHFWDIGKGEGECRVGKYILAKAGEVNND